MWIKNIFKFYIYFLYFSNVYKEWVVLEFVIRVEVCLKILSDEEKEKIYFEIAEIKN